MSTYTQIYYHIVFSTKSRHRVLDKNQRESLLRYTWGIINNHRCHLYRINAVEDHLHLLTSLHPSVSLADLLKSVKTGSSAWIKENRIFPAFDYWQEGYGAFTLSNRDKDSVIEYIKNQEEHHRNESFLEEYQRLLREADVAFDEHYLE